MSESQEEIKQSISYRDCVLKNINKNGELIKPPELNTNTNLNLNKVLPPPGLEINPNKIIKVPPGFNTIDTDINANTDQIGFIVKDKIKDKIYYDDCSDIERQKFIRKIGPKLPKSSYPRLDAEINKIRALSSFKNNLIEHVIRYFKAHKIYHGGKLKYIRRQMMNHFPNWFFKLNNEGKVIDFIPQEPLVIAISVSIFPHKTETVVD